MSRTLRSTVLGIAALAFSIFGPPAAQAEQIEINFSGVFSQGAVDTIGLFGVPGAALDGAPLGGTLGYDPLGPLTIGRRGTIEYNYVVNPDGGLRAHSLWHGGVSTNGRDFVVNSYYFIGAIFLFDPGPVDQNGLSYREMIMDVNGDNSDPFLAIEFHLWSLADFSGDQNLLTTQEGMNRYFDGLVSGHIVIGVGAQSQTLPFGSNEVSQVPAPSGLEIFGVSLIGFFAIRQHRSSHC